MSGDHDDELDVELDVFDDDLDDDLDVFEDDDDDEWRERVALVGGVVRELLADGPSSIGEIASALRERGELLPFDVAPTGAPVGGVDIGGGDRALVAFVDELLFDIDITWRAFDGTVVLIDSLFDGLVLTHRVTADELERGVLDATPDLGAITFVDAVSAPLAGGGSIELVHALDDDERFAVTGSFDGPAGWLDGVVPGSVIALRREGDTVHLLADVDVPAVDASAPEVAALRTAFDGLVEPGEGVQHDLVVVDAATIEPRAFRQPTAPIGELLGLAGLRHRGDLVGPIDAEFTSPGQRSRLERLDELARKYQFDDCCRHALDHVLDEWAEFARRSIDDQAEHPPLPDHVVDHLLHGAVAPAFADFVLADSTSAPGVLASFAHRVVDTGGRVAGTGHHLLGLAELRQSNAAQALASFESAVRLDGADSLAAVDLADLVTDTGDLVRALSSWRRVGTSPGAANHIGALSAVLDRFTTAGRNDPCPCGSGRKYKQCCMRSPKISVADRRRIALHQVGAFATRVHGRDLFGVALTAHGAVLERDGDDPDDDESMADQIAGLRRWIADPFLLDLLIHEGGALEGYLDQRGEIVPDAEREWLELVASTSRSMWHVERRGDGRADVRHVFSDRAFPDVSIGDDLSPRWTGGPALARFVPDGITGEPGFVGVVVPVPPSVAPEAVHMVDDDAGIDELVAWYALDLERPDLAPLRGEPFPPTVARFTPIADDWSTTTDELDDRFDRVDDVAPADASDGSGVGGPEWRTTVDAGRGGEVVLARLRREGDELVVRVHSIGRLSVVRDELEDAGLTYVGVEYPDGLF